MLEPVYSAGLQGLRSSEYRRCLIANETPRRYSDKGCSLSSTQEIHAKKGSKHRMCRVSLRGPRSTATAVVKGQCRCSSDADVQFYGFQINILFNLSIIYQYFAIQSFIDDSARTTIIKHSRKNWYFPLFSKLTFQACRNGP